jgi:hypothetical protein
VELMQAHDPQDGGDRPLAGDQNSPYQQHQEETIAGQVARGSPLLAGRSEPSLASAATRRARLGLVAEGAAGADVELSLRRLFNYIMAEHHRVLTVLRGDGVWESLAEREQLPVRERGIGACCPSWAGVSQPHFEEWERMPRPPGWIPAFTSSADFCSGPAHTVLPSGR